MNQRLYLRPHMHYIQPESHLEPLVSILKNLLIFLNYLLILLKKEIHVDIQAAISLSPSACTV